jgi:putative membrane protein
LDSIDESEIDAARLAIDKASAPKVRAFAGRILNEHRALTGATGRLATELPVPPEPPALASDLKQAHGKAMQEMRVRSGPDFDRAYVRYEIEQHVQAFNFLETAAQSETNLTLKQELIRTGPELLSHISAARALERHLGSEQVASR